MASRLRIALVAAVVGMLLVPSIRAEAQEFSSCWVVKDLDFFGRPRTVTRCRISGGSIVDYASDSAVPVTALRPDRDRPDRSVLVLHVCVNTVRTPPYKCRL